MLHKTVYLANLQVICPDGSTELNQVAGKLRNSFYSASFPWSEGNLGRVIPRIVFTDYYQEYENLREKFFELCGAEDNVVLTVIPFPQEKYGVLAKAPDWISAAVDLRFKGRVAMLQHSLRKKKRFYESLLTELEKIIGIGMYLDKSIEPELVKDLKRARREILGYSVRDIRKSTSVKEKIINVCGALL